MSFWGYDLGKLVVHKLAFNGLLPGTELSTIHYLSAGFLSAIPMTFVSVPFERLKILLQVQGQGLERGHSGALQILRGLYRNGGIRSIYKGSLMTFARDAPDSAAYFATYEYCKRRFTPKDDNSAMGSMSLFAISGAGASAGLVMLVPLFPIDTIKSRLQATEGKENVGSAFRFLYNRGGWKSFFPGLGPALLRALPANAAATLGWELTRVALRKLRQVSDESRREAF